MKNISKLVLALVVFATIFAGSCKKSVVNTTIIFQNNASSTVTISAGGANEDIGSGGTFSYTAVAGTAFSGTATTTGTTGFANSWDLSYVFPSSGYITVPLEEHSSLVFQNNTYTPVTITAGGNTHTIASGSTCTYSTLAGTTFLGTATTSGSTGSTINWDLNYAFPATDYATVPLNISSSYFYLYIDNSLGSSTITNLTVNYSLTDQTNESVTLPPGYKYGMGYYDANPDPYYTIIKAYSATTTWTFSPVFNFTLSNLSYSATTN